MNKKVKVIILILALMLVGVGSYFMFSVIFSDNKDQEIPSYYDGEYEMNIVASKEYSSNEVASHEKNALIYKYSNSSLNGIKSWMHWNQKDEEWASVRFKGNYTIGSSGCATVSIAYLLNMANIKVGGKDATPKNTAKKINYLSEGGIKWASTKNISKDFKLLKETQFDNQKTQEKQNKQKNEIIDMLRNYIMSNKYVVIGVQPKKGGTHFVALDYIDYNNKKIYVFDSYGNPGAGYERVEVFENYKRVTSLRAYGK